VEGCEAVMYQASLSSGLSRVQAIAPAARGATLPAAAAPLHRRQLLLCCSAHRPPAPACLRAPCAGGGDAAARHSGEGLLIACRPRSVAWGCPPAFLLCACGSSGGGRPTCMHRKLLGLAPPKHTSPAASTRLPHVRVHRTATLQIKPEPRADHFQLRPAALSSC